MKLFAALLLTAFVAHAQRPCTAKELTLTLTSQPGEFTGMSHDGTWIILRNTGHRTCTVPRRPSFAMKDKAGQPVAAMLNVPRGMHPGPFLVPIRLASGRAARSNMRWVTGEVYDHSICANVATVAFDTPGGTVSAPLAARMCGSSTDGIRYDQEWLQPDTGTRKR